MKIEFEDDLEVSHILGHPEIVIALINLAKIKDIEISVPHDTDDFYEFL